MNSDLISREDLKKELEEIISGNPVSIFTDGIVRALKVINNAPEVELANHLRDRIKDIDHEITIPQSYEAKCFLNGKRKAFQYVLDLLETKKNEQ